MAIGIGTKIAGEAAGAAVGAGMGLLLGGINDARQRRQQQKLQDMQITGQKEMMDYSQEKQLDMWNKTNYGAQMKHMKDAGLNPGLMYGMGGGGGSTTGSAAGSVAGATAAAGGGEIGMGMQLALMQAQKENIEADTANKKAGAENTGVVTETGKVDLATKQETQAATISKAKTEAETAIEEMWLKTNERTISDHTIKQRIELTAQELIGQIAKNNNTDADTKKKQAEAIIAEFDAKMTEEGISTKAPWYLKMVMDTLTKFGLNPMDTAKEAIK